MEKDKNEQENIVSDMQKSFCTIFFGLWAPNIQVAPVW